MTILKLQIEALARLAPELAFLGAMVKMGSSTAVPLPNTAQDTPSMAAILGVSSDTIPGLRKTVADRFVAVGETAHSVAMRFAEAEGVMTEDSVVTTLTRSGSLLPPAV